MVIPILFAVLMQTRTCNMPHPKKNDYLLDRRHGPQEGNTGCIRKHGCDMCVHAPTSNTNCGEGYEKDRCMYVCIYACMCECMFTCMHVCVYVSMYVCVRIQAYTHACINTQTHTHAHTHSAATATTTHKVSTPCTPCTPARLQVLFSNFGGGLHLLDIDLGLSLLLPRSLGLLLSELHLGCCRLGSLCSHIIHQIIQIIHQIIQSIHQIIQSFTFAAAALAAGAHTLWHTC